MVSRLVGWRAVDEASLFEMLHIEVGLQRRRNGLEFVMNRARQQNERTVGLGCHRTGVRDSKESAGIVLPKSNLIQQLASERSLCVERNGNLRAKIPG